MPIYSYSDSESASSRRHKQGPVNEPGRSDFSSTQTLQESSVEQPFLSKNHQHSKRGEKNEKLKKAKQVT